MNRPQMKHVSNAGKDLIRKMLTYDYTKRPTAAQCYNHKWFTKENRLDKKRLDAQTLVNFKKFHVRKILIFSTGTNSKEPSTISWLITSLQKKKKWPLQKLSRLLTQTEMVISQKKN